MSAFRFSTDFRNRAWIHGTAHWFKLKLILMFDRRRVSKWNKEITEAANKMRVNFKKSMYI